MPKPKVRLIHGLSDFHMATLLTDSSTGVTYSEIVKVEGAISVNGTPNADQNIKYANNGPFAILDSFESFDVDMAAIDIPEDMQSDMYGEKVVNGVTFSNKDDIKKEIAFSSSKAIFGIARKMLLLILCVYFIPVALLVPEPIGISALYVLYIGYLLSEINSILNHLKLADDDKSTDMFADFIGSLFKRK